MLDDDSGDAHFASVCDYTVEISQTSIGIPAVCLRIAGFDTTIPQTQCHELIKDILTKLFAGFMSVFVVTAVIGIPDLGAICRVSITTIGINVNTYKDLSTLVYRSLHAKF